jgi:hypothetical protein
VLWNARILNSRPEAFFRERVSVANATGLHLDANLSGVRLRSLSLDDLEICFGFRTLCRRHCQLWYYRYSSRCHKPCDAFAVYAFAVVRRLLPCANATNQCSRCLLTLFCAFLSWEHPGGLIGLGWRIAGCVLQERQDPCARVRRKRLVVGMSV